MDQNGVGRSKETPAKTCLGAIFMHADGLDACLMALGSLGAVWQGTSSALVLLIFARFMNTMGAGTSSDPNFSDDINKNAVRMLYVGCACLPLCFLEGYCWMMTGERQANRMRAWYLKAILRQDAAYFDLKVASTTDAITTISGDSLIVQDFISEKLPYTIMYVSTILSCYATAFFLMPSLAAAALPTIVVLAAPGIIYGKTFMGMARKIREEYNKAGAIAEQAIASVRTVYSFAAEATTMAKFSAALETSMKLGLKQGLAKGIAIGSSGVTYAIWAFVTWFGSRIVGDQGSKGGTIFTVGLLMINSGLAVGSALLNVKYFSEAISAMDRIAEVMRRTPAIDSESTEGHVLRSVEGSLEFKMVQFAYPSRPENVILEDFSLKVAAGSTVVLVGSSGSGKSTAIALLQRFYDPQAGQILLDGMDVRALELKWFRSQMGLVNQEPALFATSIKKNILFGKESATMEEVVAAANAASAHGFISQFPQGYDTQVGEGGVQMSGGQKQRIAIARAILRDPKILLFDEATSALDSESEQQILQEELVLAAAAGRTTVIVAHRLSTIRDADAIAVVQAGKIVEIGSHDELIGNERGIYSSLVSLQQMSGTQKARDFRTKSHLDGSNGGEGYQSAGRSSTDPAVAVKNVAAASDGDSKTESTKHGSPSFWDLLVLNMPEWRQGLIAGLSTTISGGIHPAAGILIGATTSAYFLKDHDERNSKLRAYALVFAALAVLIFLISVLQHYYVVSMGEHLTKRVREKMLAKILTLEVGWFDRHENSTGAVCSRLANDANMVRTLVGDRMSLMIQTASSVIVSILLSLVISWRLALVMITTHPIFIAGLYARHTLLKGMSKKTAKAQRESGKLVAEAVSNHVIVSAFSMQDRILRLFEAAQDGPRQESVKQAWYAGVTLATTQSLSRCAFALVLWYGGKLTDEGIITAAAFFKTQAILARTSIVIADAGILTSDLARGNATMVSLFEILNRRTLIEPEESEGRRTENLIGGVEIADVDFAYPSRPEAFVFKGLSLNIEAGKSTALVGQSGSGKSTVIALILRFYDLQKGTVAIDGEDIKSFHLRGLRRHIGLVSQEPVLFAGTIRENIAYGMEGATAGEIEQAARVANIHDFISCLGDGYDTQCGDRGRQLSGGQKQRVAIARAILKNPAILLLDEATSALDGQSEKAVQEALERVMAGRTSVVVAHRLNTIRNCDAIAVLENGVVVEKGTHESLLAKGSTGSYHRLICIQQGTKRSPAVEERLDSVDSSNRPSN